MELSDVQALGEKLEKIKNEDFNEETTKLALIIPFVKMLGYEPSNPMEVRLEYTADFGVKKGDRVDIAILKDGAPIIIIECKPLQADLDSEKRSQLYAYFAASVGTRVGLLTNGRQYQFFSDLDEKNLMDDQPFMSFDLLAFDKRLLPALQKLCKESWDIDTVMDSATRLKRLAAVKAQIEKDALEPDDEVVRHFASVCHSGKLMQTVIDQFRPLVVQAFKDYVSDQIMARLKSTEPQPEPVPAPAPEPEPGTGIVTHDSEKYAYIAVKALLGGFVDPARVQIRDYKTFCAVQLDGKVSKTFCRFRNFEPVAEDGTIGKCAAVEIMVGGKDADPARHSVQTVEDILPLADELRQAARTFMEA